jgi:hypothetical protein
MNFPSRFEVEKLANEIFGADREGRIVEFAKERNRALAKVRSTGNIGGYGPALVQSGAESLRSEILTLADAWVEAFEDYGMPSDALAEEALEKAASQMAGETVSGIRAQLHLLKVRTRKNIRDVGGHLERTISATGRGALRIGKLRMKRQRIKFRNSEIPAQLARLPVVHRAGGAVAAASTPATSGKPTEGGIDVARKSIGVSAVEPAQQNETPEMGASTHPNSQLKADARLRRSAGRLMKKYEDRCPLLNWQSLDRLKQRGERREAQLGGQIEASTTHVRERLQELERVRGKSKRKTANAAIQQEATSLREDIVGVAANAATEGVREFGNALLVSQGRLAVHADLLRDYTARLVTEIRNKLSASELFRTAPRLPWQQDPITQTAIQACEEILTERWKTGDGLPYGANELNGSNPAWSPVVQAWEASQGVDSEAGWPKRISESLLRTFLSTQHRVKPNDVTQEQIRQAGKDLCLHYGSILVIPLEAEASEPSKPEPESMATAQFWKEREEEFRAHAADNRGLFAEWSSMSDAWSFRAGSGLESPTPGAEQIFKALAREAAKGLVGSASADLSEDWLDALRRKTDKSTGRRLYSELSATSTHRIGTTWLERMAQLGEPVPPRGMIEFVARQELDERTDQSNQTGTDSETNATEQRMFWDATTERIDRLFNSSANLCLEFRSLAPYPRSRALTKPAVPVPEDLPTIADVETALNGGDRKKALKLRCLLDDCKVNTLWKDAFSSRGGKLDTKRTAFNRWRASRNDTPSWADELIRARLLK